MRWKEIQYYMEKDRKEQERCNEANLWIDALYESLRWPS